MTVSRRHVKTKDADLTGAVKYTRLVDTINRKRKHVASAKLQPLNVRCPTCGAAVGEGCHTLSKGVKRPTKRHARRMDALRAVGVEPPTKEQAQRKEINQSLGLPDVDLRRPSHVQRHMKFARFNTTTGLPRCGWSGCGEPVSASGKPYCSGHHQRAYGSAPVCSPVNVT